MLFDSIFESKIKMGLLAFTFSTFVDYKKYAKSGTLWEFAVQWAAPGMAVFF